MSIRIAFIGLCLAVPAFSQVITQPQTVRGTVRFNNSNPAVLAILDSPSNEGMSSLYIYASGRPPAPALGASASMAASGRVSSSYEIIVESDAVGYPYDVTARAAMNTAGTYYFAPRTSPPVTPSGGPVTLNVSECVGILDVQFVSAAGAPQAVVGASVRAYRPPASSAGAPDSEQSRTYGGGTGIRLAMRAGEAFVVETSVRLGASTALDRIQFKTTTNLTVLCDTIQTLRIVVPNARDLGRIDGNFDVLREFEHSIDGNDFLDYADSSAVVARYGPFDNVRYANLPGVNFSVPSSGPFSLVNLLPDSADPASDGYTVYGQAYFRTGSRFSGFTTPALGWGSNPSVVVPPGGTVSLGNTFVVDPGYIRGRVLLRGPAESPAGSSLLRGMSRAADNDLNSDGIPDGAGTYGVYWSSIGARGVDRLAPGATRTAAFGYASSSFEGGFVPANNSFEGDYELVAGGLNGERSIWTQSSISLALDGGDAGSGTYFANIYSITDLNAPQHEITPTQSVNRDLSYCMSEVFVQFRSNDGLFHSPQIRFSPGSFNGTDFQGNPANYQVYLDAMFGAPSDPNAPTNSGYVRMILPEGTYDLLAYVVPAGASAGSLTQVERFTLRVGCGQHIRIEQCLQLSLDASSCISSPRPEIRGRVESCAKVTRITYQIDRGAEQVVCRDCGVNPEFSFTPAIESTPCGSTRLTVTAYDADGATSFVTTTLIHDSEPPALKCPEDITVDCGGDGAGARVNYSVSAADNCTTPVAVVCDPPSGSVFPPGTTEVKCVARDACGNTTRCSFKVTVNPPGLSIERAVILKWTCGVLQCSESEAGPWVDLPTATSPYCVPADKPKKLYRIRAD